MSRDRAIVVTTINAPTRALERLSHLSPDWDLIVVGDRKSPPSWRLPGARYYSVADQLALDLRFPRECRYDSYVRKNIGYLIAMTRRSSIIAETDDDNEPHQGYLTGISESVAGALVRPDGWVNVYRLFSDELIWPRGFPLARLKESLRSTPPVAETAERSCPIQQFLADGDPDVDAIHRLIWGNDYHFSQGTFLLGPGTFCPFNSQNTVWWRSAFPLLYLPSTATFRMTDIWRSFVAQVCLYAAGGHIAFHGPTMQQDRNVHSLLRDFRDEVPGYLRNEDLVQMLLALDLSSDPSDIMANMRLCYAALVRDGYLDDSELPLLDLWLADVSDLTA